MVAIDSSHDISVRREQGHAGLIVLSALAVAGALIAASVLTADVAGTGWRLAAEMVARFSLLLFAAAMSVEPVSRLLPFGAIRGFGRERASLMIAFAVTSAIGLVCLAAPSQFGGDPLTLPTIAYVVLTGLILVVMLFSSHPAMLRGNGAPVARALQRIATSYFWLVFVLTGIERLVGPHRPDNWHGFALLLLTATLLLRFTDSFVAHWRSGVAGKVA